MNELHIKLQNYSSIYPEEIVTKIKMLEFLNEYENPFSRDLQIGHFTASAFLLNNDKTKFLLMHHKKLDKWLQPGGHCDGDSNILNVAVKEAMEESGINEIKTINKEIFDIDTHYIPQTHKDPAHYHYDVRFLLKTVDNDNFIKNNESNELKWFNFSDYSKLDIELERSDRKVYERFYVSYRGLTLCCIERARCHSRFRGNDILSISLINIMLFFDIQNIFFLLHKSTLGIRK